ncbi:MAG: hypothetical protein ACOVOR_00655 [Rhabdochlamydiaceae bacterium]
MEERLLMALEYLKEYRIDEHTLIKYVRMRQNKYFKDTNYYGQEEKRSDGNGFYK